MIKIMNDVTCPSVFTLCAVENFVSEHGRFCFVDWLLNENILEYSQYENWRHQKEDVLDTLILLEHKELELLTDGIEEMAQQLGLVYQSQEYFSWGDSDHKILSVSKNKKLHVGLSAQWVRPADLPQMDLFMDNSAVITESDLLCALGGRQFDRAQDYLRRLTSLNAHHQKLGNYQDLINYGLHMTNGVIELCDVEVELSALESEVRPLVLESLGQYSRDYMAYAWRRLSYALEGCIFNPNSPKRHNSYVLMQIPDWPLVITMILKEPLVFKNIHLTHRLATCYEMVRRDNEAVITWALMMELDPEYCESVIERKESALMWTLWQDYWEFSENGSTLLFSAYILMRKIRVEALFSRFPAFKFPANQLIKEAIGLGLQHKDEILIRKKMQELTPSLLDLYLSMNDVE